MSLYNVHLTELLYSVYCTVQSVVLCKWVKNRFFVFFIIRPAYCMYVCTLKFPETSKFSRILAKTKSLKRTMRELFGNALYKSGNRLQLAANIKVKNQILKEHFQIKLIIFKNWLRKLFHEFNDFLNWPFICCCPNDLFI